MALLPLFSRRKRDRERTGEEVYVYDFLPQSLRVQIYMNLSKGINATSDYRNSPEDFFSQLVKELREEVGTVNLTNRYNHDHEEEFKDWFLEVASVDHAFDAIELWAIYAYMRSQFDGLRTLLESSVPTTRNRAGGHGSGAEAREVPQSLAALQLHQTASLIVFLAALE